MTQKYDAIDVLRLKRDKQKVPAEALQWFIDAYVEGKVADTQMAAFAMATLLNGMDNEETRALTHAMKNSGEILNFSHIGKTTVDKHSTGGVGDKITLPLAPLVASFGVAVPQLSGRGLGHTGGTLDKLESIPGWRASMSNDEFESQLKSVGAVVCAAGADLAPADKKLYALRDITGTVESIPLIAASIMSKKLAEGAESLVLDVKFGSGAFMKTSESARELAELMVAIGHESGVATTAFLTDMNTPLGLAIGNANEVRESLEVLAGGGPEDVVELTVTLAREMLALAGKPDVDVEKALKNGQAMDTWHKMIRAQGGDPLAKLPEPSESHVVVAPEAGFVQTMDAFAFGVAAWRLGAGRGVASDPVIHEAGIDLHMKPGAWVEKGVPLFTLHARDDKKFERALESLAGGWSIGSEKPEQSPLVLDRLG